MDLKIDNKNGKINKENDDKDRKISKNNDDKNGKISKENDNQNNKLSKENGVETSRLLSLYWTAFRVVLVNQWLVTLPGTVLFYGTWMGEVSLSWLSWERLNERFGSELHVS